MLAGSGVELSSSSHRSRLRFNLMADAASTVFGSDKTIRRRRAMMVWIARARLAECGKAANGRRGEGLRGVRTLVEQGECLLEL